VRQSEFSGLQYCTWYDVAPATAFHDIIAELLSELALDADSPVGAAGSDTVGVGAGVGFVYVTSDQSDEPAEFTARMRNVQDVCALSPVDVYDVPEL